jgi:hypothetical protein
MASLDTYRSIGSLVNNLNKNNPVKRIIDGNRDKKTGLKKEKKNRN